MLYRNEGVIEQPGKRPFSSFNYHVTIKIYDHDVISLSSLHVRLLSGTCRVVLFNNTATLLRKLIVFLPDCTSRATMN